MADIRDVTSADAERLIEGSERRSRLEPISGAKEIGALAHIYRAEVYRSTVWRQRLDMTTNWAVVSTGIGLSISFASPQADPLPIVLVTLLSVMFLMLEARRYRYFHVWKFRARVMELAVWVPMLRGEGARIPQDRGDALSEDYLHPRFRISNIRAIGRRIRRNYAFLFTIQGLAYFSKISIHPTEMPTFDELVRRAHIGPVPGELSLIVGMLFHGTWIAIAWYTWRKEQADHSTTEDVLVDDDDAGPEDAAPI